MSNYKAIPGSGFIIDSFDERDYIFGSQRSLDIQEILAPNSQWDDWKPMFEEQRNEIGTDPWICTNEAFTSCLEFIHKRKYGDENNQSERFSALISGTKPNQGNSIKAPAEAARLKGSVKQEIMPYPQTMTEAEFYNYNDLTPEVMKKGEEWLEEYDFGYEKIQLGNVMNKEKAMEALKFSPLQTAIDSSTKNKANFRGWNDSVVIYGYEYGKYWKVFGSYIQTTGNFDWSYPFYTPFKFHLVKKKIFNLNNMKLIKGDLKPEIFLQDFDGKKHWIKTMNDLQEIFGINVQWETKPQIEIDAIQSGVDISLKDKTLVEAIRQLLLKLGVKKE